MFFCALCTTHQFLGHKAHCQCKSSELGMLLCTLPFCLVKGECLCQQWGVACKKSMISMALCFSWHRDNGAFLSNCKEKGNLTTSYSLSWPHPIIPPWQNWRDDLDMFLLGPSNVPKATCNSYVHSLADNSLLPTGNAHVSEKYAGQNARSWMTDSCLQNVMTKNTSCAQCTTVATSKELIISSLCQSTTDNCYLCSIVIVCTAVKSIRVAIQSLSKRRESLFVSFTSHVCLGHIWFHSFLCQSSPSSNYYWQKKAKLVSLKEGNKQHLLVVIRTGSVTAWKLSQNQYKIHVESNWDFLKNSI
jgi:hypothetical protein